MPEIYIKEETCFLCDVSLKAPYYKIPNTQKSYKAYCIECYKFLIRIYQQQLKMIKSVDEYTKNYRYINLEENIRYIIGNVKKVKK